MDTMDQSAAILAALDFPAGCQVPLNQDGDLCGLLTKTKWVCLKCGLECSLCRSHDTLQFFEFERDETHKFRCSECGLRSKSWRAVWKRVKA